MSSATDFANGNDFRARYLALHEQGESTLWDKGALLFDRVRASARSAANPRERRKLRASILREAAAEVGQTVSAVRQQFEVTATFGTSADASRAEDKPWFWHLCLMRAAHRNKLPVGDLLTEAIDKGWSAADLNALGKVAKVQAELSADCPDCGLGATFKLAGDRADADALAVTLRCPLCAGRALKAGGNPAEAARMGRLESANDDATTATEAG